MYSKGDTVTVVKFSNQLGKIIFVSEREDDYGRKYLVGYISGDKYKLRMFAKKDIKPGGPFSNLKKGNEFIMKYTGEEYRVLAKAHNDRTDCMVYFSKQLSGPEKGGVTHISDFQIKEVTKW